MAARPDEPAAVPGRPRRILVADDHAINRLLVRRQLLALGFTVDEAETGREVLEAMAHQTYDLVLMDCHMPEMDGFEATRAIRDREGTSRRTPIVALTVTVNRSDRDACLAAGMDDFASKPVPDSELLRILNRWIFEVGTPVIDAARIEVLRQTTAGLVDELIGIYIEEAPRRIAAIQDAVRGGDAAGLAAAAHGLRSSSGNVGATRVVELCGSLEAIGRAGGTAGAPELTEELMVEYARARRALRGLE
jgi:two-component system sensor histidine kinase/response regulator